MMGKNTPIVLFFLLLTPALAAANECLNDDPDTDVEWVSSGSAKIAWGRTYELVIGEGSEEGDDVYTLRADDFDVSLSASAISIEKDREVRRAILNLNRPEDDRCFDWDSEMKVELTDITTDSHETPSAQLKFYRRGLPELDIDIDATSEDFDEIHVSSDQYAPEEEKTITIDVRNAGDAWIETVELEVNVGELKLKGYNGLEFHDQTIYKNLGCMEKNAKESINFTVIAPAWDGITSPYEINYSISAYAKGFNIKDWQHETNNSLTLTCTDPEIRVVKSVSYDEINMSPCNLVRSNKYSLREVVEGMPEAVIYNVSEWSVVELRVYNVGFYSVRNLNITDSQIPDGLRVARTYTKGSPACVSKETPYSIGYKLFPTKPGEYTFDAPSVEADFYGKDFSWESSGVTITVHGPHINLTKTVAEPEGGDYKVTLNLRNDGDRAAYINLTDTVPAGAGYIEESAEEGIAGGGLPLSEWDLDLCKVDDSQRIAVEGVLLPPGTALEASYLIRPDRFDKPDLPYAEVWFRARNYYEGVVRSSFWESGVEVVQIWDPSAGGWVTPDNGSGWEGVNETAAPTPTPAEPSNSTQFKTSQQVLLNRSDGNQTNQTTLHISQQLSGMTDRLPHQLRAGMGWAGSAVGTVVKMASTITDTSLTLIVILIAVSGFSLAFVLLRTGGPPVLPGT
ncbi:MAG: hypothetical protein C5S48_08275 [Candidatus Methanogaster sp.]|nr:MAG: hypothetical protein C5S48_08275 [ANME-2 cluster archaeon]